MALKYRLNTLGWYNIEALVQTLLKAIIGPGVTSFGGSKDGGRDATFEGLANYPSEDNKWSGEWIFQVKSSELETATANKEGKSLISAFKEELKRLGKGNFAWPDNYILITNVRLTKTLRDGFYSVISDAGFAGNFNVIDGKELCEFLDIYPHIRRSFPQLISIADISQILDREILNRSTGFLSNWLPRLETFVAVEQYKEAIEFIEEKNFAILAGPPEMGKSFIGAAITVNYASIGYEVYDMTNPQQILQVHDPLKKQIFIADDAVGAIAFDPDLGDKWGRDLHTIVGSKLDSKHKLIWTTRSYILNEAVDTTKLEENDEKFPTGYEVVVEVRGFTLIEKALILYNHAKVANLSRTVRQLLREYAEIITKSESFTPERIRRLIASDLMCVKGDLTKDKRQTWIDAVLKFLDDPSARFERAYNALGVSEKLLLLSLFDQGSYAKKDDLRKDYDKRLLIV